MSYCTSIYGLKVQLNKQIPGVACHDSIGATPDIDIQFGLFPPWFQVNEVQRELWYEASSSLTIWELTDKQAFQLCYADGTQFLVDVQGKEIWATWPIETLTLEDTATYLLGPVMGFVLLLRGHVPLHASAVAFGDAAVAFVGPAGAGKSTTAAALADLGYRVISEDVVTLKELGNSFLVEPGYPCIRLWPESVEALYGPDVELPRLTPTWDKRFLDLTQKHYRQKRALPLTVIYVLGARTESPEAPFVQPMSQRQALMSLVSNTYVTRLKNQQMRANEFKVLTGLLKNTTVRQLIPHSGPDRIANLCEKIMEDLAGLQFGKTASRTQPHFLHV
ncbi:MAG TPA: hypothetical protein VF074_00800 [Pyrinomonadaceae bacterium]